LSFESPNKWLVGIQEGDTREHQESRAQIGNETSGHSHKAAQFPLSAERNFENDHACKEQGTKQNKGKTQAVDQ
jgi:hypothetical protein